MKCAEIGNGQHEVFSDQTECYLHEVVVDGAANEGSMK